MNLTTQVKPVNTVVHCKLKFIKAIALITLSCFFVGCSDDWPSIKSSIQFRPAEVIDDKKAVLEQIKVLDKKSNDALDSEKHDEALPILEKKLALQERLYGTKHGDVALSCSYIGVILSKIGKHQQAKRYLERALAIVEAVYGLQDAETFTSLNEIGLLLLTMGENEQAKYYLDRAKVLEEKIRVDDTLY